MHVYIHLLSVPVFSSLTMPGPLNSSTPVYSWPTTRLWWTACVVSWVSTNRCLKKRKSTWSWKTCGGKYRLKTTGLDWKSENRLLDRHHLIFKRTTIKDTVSVKDWNNSSTSQKFCCQHVNVVIILQVAIISLTGSCCQLCPESVNFLLRQQAIDSRWHPQIRQADQICPPKHEWIFARVTVSYPSIKAVSVHWGNHGMILVQIVGGQVCKFNFTFSFFLLFQICSDLQDSNSRSGQWQCLVYMVLVLETNTTNTKNSNNNHNSPELPCLSSCCSWVMLSVFLARETANEKERVCCLMTVHFNHCNYWVFCFFDNMYKSCSSQPTADEDRRASVKISK